MPGYKAETPLQPQPRAEVSVKTVQRECSGFTVDLELVLVNLMPLKEKCLNGARKT